MVRRVLFYQNHQKQRSLLSIYIRVHRHSERNIIGYFKKLRNLICINDYQRFWFPMQNNFTLMLSVKRFHRNTVSSLHWGWFHAHYINAARVFLIMYKNNFVSRYDMDHILKDYPGNTIIFIIIEQENQIKCSCTICIILRELHIYQ